MRDSKRILKDFDGWFSWAADNLRQAMMRGKGIKNVSKPLFKMPQAFEGEIFEKSFLPFFRSSESLPVISEILIG